MNESKGIPASPDAHCETVIGFDLEGRLAASTSTKVARHQMKRERVLKNMWIVLIQSAYTRWSLQDCLYNSSATEAMADYWYRD
jgi:hypothetical protein